MNEHDQIIAIIAGKNQSPIDFEPGRTALVVVDMQRCFTQPSFPFTEIFEKLSPGSSAGFLKRTRETVLPSIQRLLRAFRATRSPVVFTAVGTEAGTVGNYPHGSGHSTKLDWRLLGNASGPPSGTQAGKLTRL